MDEDKPLFDNGVYLAAYLTTSFVFGWVMRARVEGLENVPRSGRLLIACNHLSMVDPPLVAWAIARRRIGHFLGKAELFENPVSAWVLRNLHSIPLDRGRGDVGALRRAMEILEGGACLVLFPEGTRSKTGLPGRPKAGVGLLAADSGAPVVPARVFGTWGFPRGGPLGIRFGRALRFGEEGEPRDKTGYHAFAERAMAAVQGL